MRRLGLTRIALYSGPVVLALASNALILLLVGADPLAAYGNILGGAFEGPRKMADVLVAAVPLLLCAAGMLVTFACGLWNIGVEGQMVAGAIVTTWAVRTTTAAAWVAIPLSILAGMVGGALWGLLAGVLRVHGHVNEIFGGLGLNFVATALTNYLIFGPWKPSSGATMSGTEPFPQQALLPLLGETRASAISLGLALLAIAGAFCLLRGTRLGLRLKAVGINERAARRLGVHTAGVMLLAFALCGAMAGLAGSFQATGVYRRLIPGISGGYGYLSQLVVLLSGLRAEWVPLVVAFFSVVQVGSPRLELRMQLDSALGGVLQSSVVLFFVLMQGVRQRWQSKRA